jgi:hypothetical protein
LGAEELGELDWEELAGECDDSGEENVIRFVGGDRKDLLCVGDAGRS